MDGSSSLQGQFDLSKLTDNDKKELQQFIVNESQKARIQQSMLCIVLRFLLPSFLLAPLNSHSLSLSHPSTPPPHHPPTL